MRPSIIHAICVSSLYTASTIAAPPLPPSVTISARANPEESIDIFGNTVTPSPPGFTSVPKPDQFDLTLYYDRDCQVNGTGKYYVMVGPIDTGPDQSKYKCHQTGTPAEGVECYWYWAGGMNPQNSGSPEACTGVVNTISVAVGSTLGDPEGMVCDFYANDDCTDTWGQPEAAMSLKMGAGGALDNGGYCSTVPTAVGPPDSGRPSEAPGPEATERPGGGGSIPGAVQDPSTAQWVRSFMCHY